MELTCVECLLCVRHYTMHYTSFLFGVALNIFFHLIIRYLYIFMKAFKVLASCSFDLYHNSLEKVLSLPPALRSV